MKKLFAASLILTMFSLSVSAESLLGFNFGTGYRNNNFEYEGLKHNVDYWSNFGGFSYTFYPSYASFLGLSLCTNFPNLEIAVGRDISDDGRNSDYHYIEEQEYVGTSETLSFGVSADIAVNLRLPLKNMDKSFSFLRLGGTYRLAFWDAWMVRNNNAPTTLSYEKQVDGWQNSFGIFAEIGRNYGKGEVSLKFVYDLLAKSELTGNEYITPKSFGILFSCRPRTWRIESTKDKSYMKSLLSKENVYSKEYKLYDKKKMRVGDGGIPFFTDTILNSETQFDESIYEIPVTAEYYRRIAVSEDETWHTDSKPFIRVITYTKHTLGKGKAGTNEYTAWTEETVSLPFYTDEEKQKAFDAIVAESECRRQQKERVAENERIAKNAHDAIYEKALVSKNINALEKYIDENRGSKYFHDEAYTEIAKLVTKNNSIELKDLPYINNPYGLDKNCLYYVSALPVYQWTGNGSFLAEVSADKVIFIRNAYDLSKINGGALNAYLKYIGSYEYNSISGAKQVVAEFDLVYSFGSWYY